MCHRWLIMSDPCIGPVVSVQVVNVGLSYWTSPVNSQHSALVVTVGHSCWTNYISIGTNVLDLLFHSW